MSVKSATLPPLGFGYGDLEPVLSESLLKTHHSKHHNTYVVNYNKAVEDLNKALTSNDTAGSIKHSRAVIFNGGGHYNHSFYWDTLSPISKNGGKFPNEDSELSKMVKRDFNSYDNLISEMTTRGLGVQGSGWVWLAKDLKTSKLVILETMNQDILNESLYKPLLNIDVWEHAYYIDYQNLRANYLKEFWRIVDWSKVNANLGSN